MFNEYDDIFLEGYMDAFDEAEEDLDVYDYDNDEVDFDNEYEDSFMEGYYTAINEIISNPLPVIGGGDIKGDLLSMFGLGNGPERAAAIKNYFDNGNTIQGGLLGGTYGQTNGVSYRNNRYLPGSGNTAGANAGSMAGYDFLYMRLKPDDRKKIMSDYIKKHGGIKKK